MMKVLDHGLRRVGNRLPTRINVTMAMVARGQLAAHPTVLPGRMKPVVNGGVIS